MPRSMEEMLDRECERLRELLVKIHKLTENASPASAMWRLEQIEKLSKEE